MPDSRSATARTGYLEVLREHAGFRHLFLARTASLLGDWFNLLGILALLREVTDPDPRIVGGVFIIKLLPAFVVGPAAGVVADRFDRKRILLVADVLRFFLVAALFAAPQLPEQATTLVFTLTFLQMATAAFAEPARQATLPNLVSPRALAAANALSAVAWSTVFTLGAALGGVVTDLFGWRFALALDATTYLVSASLIVRIVFPKRFKPRTSYDLGTITGARDLAEGARYIAGHRRVAAVMLLKSGWGLAGAISLLLTLFGEGIYAVGGRPDLGISLLYVARALGTGIGPLLSRRITGELSSHMRPLIGLAFAWGALWYAVFAIVHHPALAFICVVVAHFGGSIVWVDSTVLLQRMVPDEFRGRVFGIKAQAAPPRQDSSRPHLSGHRAPRSTRDSTSLDRRGHCRRRIGSQSRSGRRMSPTEFRSRRPLDRGTDRPIRFCRSYRRQ